MRTIVKILVTILVIFLIIFTSLWLYLALKVASELNQYADQPIKLTSFDQQTHFISFQKARITGFPHKLAWKLEDFSEETKEMNIKSNKPVYLGYNFFSQKLFINYCGIVKFLPKLNTEIPAINLAVDKHELTIDLPITRKFLLQLKKMKTAIELINYFGPISVKVKNMSFTDPINNKLISKIDYDQIDFTFSSQNYYNTLTELLNNIPEHLVLNYKSSVKSTRNAKELTHLPFLYKHLITNIDHISNLQLDLKHQTLTKNHAKELSIHLTANSDSPYLALNQLTAQIHNSKLHGSRNYVIKTNADLKLKKGVFNYLFTQYQQSLRPKLANSFLNFLDKEIQIIIKNKDKLAFTQLEDSNYQYNLSMALSNDTERSYLKIDDFNIYADNQSGFQLNCDADRNLWGRDWRAKGVVLIKNYPAVIDAGSNYIYRLGKFKNLTEQARNLYKEVNKVFLKEISDYPKSSSNDLSFTYTFDSKHSVKNKIGTIKAHQLSKLYNLDLYQKLLSMVNNESDLLEQMQKIIPSIKADGPILNNILKRKARELKLLQPK